MLNDCLCYDLGSSLETLLDKIGHGSPHIFRAHTLGERGGLVAERPTFPDRQVECSNYSTLHFINHSYYWLSAVGWKCALYFVT